MKTLTLQGNANVLICSYLNKQGVAESKSTLQILSKGIIQEAIHNCKLAMNKSKLLKVITPQNKIFSNCSPSLGDFAVSVFVEDECRGLSGGVDDEGVAVESLDHDGILDAQVVRGQCVGLPLQTLISTGQVLQYMPLEC